MKIRKPDYYDRFQCIAGACSDSCCIGWEIDVDEDRREAYRKVGGDLGERLRICIDWEEGHFILQGKEERCPFLNNENLCDLIIGLGEESLCDICREHPRYYEWYEDLTEVGVGLCCEAAAKLILESEEPAMFVETYEQEDEDSDDTLEVLFDARETAYKLLQDRSVSIWTRLRTFMNYIEELQQALDFENLDEVEESSDYYRNLILKQDGLQDEENGEFRDIACDEDRVTAYKKILDFCKQLEPIDEAWPKRLEQLIMLTDDSENFCRLENQLREQYKLRDYEYEHLAVYLVYRYFMKCRTDGDVYSKGCLTVFMILLIHLLDLMMFADSGSVSKECRTIHAKDCSKEIEYSEENLAILADLFWEHGFDQILFGL